MLDRKGGLMVASIAYLPWIALLAWLSSLAWFLCDDAFISFRYTRNLIEGHGLVFNPGEHVEGYTNFLWILELAALWAVFGIRPEHAALWLSVAYTAATIAAILWWAARLPSLRNRGPVAWMTLGLLCSSATFAVWTSGGLETRQFTFFTVAAVVCLNLYANSPRGLLIASFSLAAAALTRPEGLMLAACCFAWFALQRLITEKRVNTGLLRQTLYLVAPFALLVAAHFLFRYAYYGEWLPNTYYAKHVRPWYESGFRYLWAAALETGLYLLLPLAFLALRTRWLNHRDLSFALPILCVAAHMAYLLPIGGDHYEYRPLDFYWPLLAFPAAEAIARLGAKAASGMRRLPRLTRWPAATETCWIVLFLPVLFYANAIQGFLLFEDASIRSQTGKAHAELNQENADWLLAAPGMPALTAVSNDMRNLIGQHWVGIRFAHHRNYGNWITQGWMPYEQMERSFIPNDALMEEGAMGRFYFMPALKVVDSHGLVDATVARTPVTHSNQERKIAHDRHPTPEYHKQRGVNIKIFLPASSAADALNVADYAVNFGPDLWMPFNTVDAQWATSRFADRDLMARKTFSTSHPDRNRFLIGQHAYVGEEIIAHFQDGSEGWHLSGRAFSNFNQHANYHGQPLLWGRADSHFLTSYHPTKGNQATGRALSPTFTAAHDQYLAFLIAGGNLDGVGLRLLADGRETAAWRGSNPKQFELIVHPLGYVAGKTLQLELFDYELGDRGHIMLDHVLLTTCNICPSEPPALAQALIHNPPDGVTAYLIPGIHNHRSVEYHFMSQGIAPTHVIHMNASNLAQEVEFALAASQDLSMVKVVEWKSETPWIGDNAQPLAFLLTKYGRFLGSHEYDQFTVHNYIDISFEHTWSFDEPLQPLNINYDGGIVLQGVAFGHHTEQLRHGHPLNLKQERALWGLLKWQTEPALETDFVTSLRLYNAKGERAFQQDAVLWNPIHLPTSYWPAGESVQTIALLQFPADLPPGEYELRLVVYDFQTQIPTVQIDVWKPETTLARLHTAQVDNR